MIPFVERFEAHWTPEPNTGCNLWTGCRQPNGYGWFRLGNRAELAHRVAWFIKHGTWPTKLILHRCDTPACVNVDHLFEGTVADNNHDMMMKGRAKFVRGEASGRHKLTEDEVHEVRRMRSQRYTHREIADAFDVGRTCISAILNGENWAWLKETPKCGGSKKSANTKCFQHSLPNFSCLIQHRAATSTSP